MGSEGGERGASRKKVLCRSGEGKHLGGGNGRKGTGREGGDIGVNLKSRGCTRPGLKKDPGKRGGGGAVWVVQGGGGGNQRVFLAETRKRRRIGQRRRENSFPTRKERSQRRGEGNARS